MKMTPYFKKEETTLVCSETSIKHEKPASKSEQKVRLEDEDFFEFLESYNKRASTDNADPSFSDMGSPKHQDVEVINPFADNGSLENIDFESFFA